MFHNLVPPSDNLVDGLRGVRLSAVDYIQFTDSTIVHMYTLVLLEAIYISDTTYDNS